MQFTGFPNLSFSGNIMGKDIAKPEKKKKKKSNHGFFVLETAEYLVCYIYIKENTTTLTG